LPYHSSSFHPNALFTTTTGSQIACDTRIQAAPPAANQPNIANDIFDDLIGIDGKNSYFASFQKYKNGGVSTQNKQQTIAATQYLIGLDL
jgi:hypothetical protein